MGLASRSWLWFALLVLAHATPLEVFIVPHSHCDAGYKKTVEGYFLTEVSRTLDSVTHALSRDPSLRFVWSESVFLWRWWQEATPSSRAAFGSLVESGQIELVNGGFVMHDESLTSYEAQIHQMRSGHDLLRSLGFSESRLPRIGWQIDPFGPSSWSPTFSALAGFDAWVTNRIPDQIKDRLKANRSLEFVWQGSATIPPAKSRVLTHVLDTHYESPKHFDFEPPNHWSDSAAVTDANVQERSDEFMGILSTRAQWYRTPLLFMLQGGDYEYQTAEVNFGNMSRLMTYINDNGDRYQAMFGVRPHLRYATPREYFDRLHALSPELPLLHGSHFLPLVTTEDGSSHSSSWSGYYSSYPELKEAARMADSLLRTAEAFAAIAGPQLPGDLRRVLGDVRRDVDLLPHHDNIVATGVNFNNVDLLVRLRRATKGLEDVIAGATAVLALNTTATKPDANSGSCLSAPTLVVDPDVLRAIDDGQAPLPVRLVNSLGWRRQEVVQLRVSRADVMVADSSGKTVVSQVSPDLSEDGAFRLYFEADVPALGWSTYYVSVCLLTHWTIPYPLPPQCATAAQVLDAAALQQRGGLFNGHDMWISIDTNACALAAVTLTSGADGTSMMVPLRHKFESYYSPADSVYYFAPTSPPEPKAIRSCRVTGLIGPLVEEAVAETDAGIGWSVRVVRSNLTSQHVPIQLTTSIAALQKFEDLVMSFEPGDVLPPDTRLVIHENGVERQPLTPHPELPIGQTYHPLVSRMALQSPGSGVDASVDLHVVVHAPHGVTTRRRGHVEMMLHRRAAYQALRGNDVSTATSTHYLIVGRPTQTEPIANRLAITLQAPLVPVTPPLAWPAPRNAAYSDMKPTFTALDAPLPDNVHLLALVEPAFEAAAEPSAPTQVTLQLQDIVDSYAVGRKEQPTQVTLDVSKLLGLWPRKVVKMEERTITSLYRSERLKQRLEWAVEGETEFVVGRDSRLLQDPVVRGCQPMVDKTGRLCLSVPQFDFCTVELRFEDAPVVAPSRHLRIPT